MATLPSTILPPPNNWGGALLEQTLERFQSKVWALHAILALGRGILYLAARLNEWEYRRCARLPGVINLHTSPAEARAALERFRKRREQFRQGKELLELINGSEVSPVTRRWLKSFEQLHLLVEDATIRLEAVAMLDARRSELLFLPLPVSRMVTEISHLRANAEGYFDRQEVKEWLNSPSPLTSLPACAGEGE